MQILGIIIGIVSGIVWEFLATSPYKEHHALFPSLFINNSTRVIHIHHWLIYLASILIVIILSAKAHKIFHPAVLMVLSFLLAAIVYNVLRFTDLYKFLK